MDDRTNEKGPPGEEPLGSQGAHDTAAPSVYGDNADAATPRCEESLAVLKAALPRGPWCLAAIRPKDHKDDDGALEVMTFLPGQEDKVRMFWEQWCGKRNMYWTPNPVKRVLVTKPSKGDIREVAWLWVDIDPKKGRDLRGERERILALLRSLPADGIPAPSLIVDSGGGYQAFWKLAEPVLVDGNADELARWNEVLRDRLGGDPVQSIEHLMRLPGTVNLPDYKKRAKGRTEPAPAKVVPEPTWQEHELRDFPQPDGKARAAGNRKRAKGGDAVPVEKLDDLPVGDLCKRVIAQGCDPDDPNRWPSRSEALYFVCCELVRAGIDDAKIVGIITDPVWDISASVREQPHPAEYAQRQVERAHEAELAGPPLLDKEEPRHSARQFRRREMPHLMRHNGDWLHHSGAAYSELEDATVKARVYDFLDGAQQASGKGPPHPFCPTKAKVANVLDALEALAHVPADSHSPPCWLGQTGPPPAEIVACSNGLLHLPTGELLPLTHEFFTRNALAIDYRADAPTPTRWLQFLDELWPGDAGSTGTLQEMFGYVLVPDTTQQKIFLLVGPPRSGKGTIARVLAHLVGTENACAPTLNSIGGEFGLQPLIGKQLAIVSDMRLGGRTDPAVVAENLLRISGEDMVTANRKYKSAWSGRLAVRFLVMTNEIPKFADASGALASRFVPLVMSESFLGREDPGLANALMRELPGILCWAVEGWRRLRDRGHFVLPEAARETMQTMSDLASPVSAFVRDECEVAPDAQVPTKDLFNAWQVRCQARGEYAGTDGTFGKDLRAVLPRVRTTRLWCGGERPTFYVGIRLAKVMTVPHDYGADAGAGWGPDEKGDRHF